jgi:carboxyl-terminal processing protease
MTDSATSEQPASAGPSSLTDDGPPVAERRRGGVRASTIVAIFLVAAIGGGALFVSGFALGRLAGSTPGTAADQQDLFRPFWDAYNDITNNYVGQVDQHLLVEGAIGGLFSALGDPFSQYLTEEEYRASLSGLSGEFEGIGVEMATQDAQGNGCETVSDTCQLVITRVIRGSPALAAGLQAGDVIVAVDSNSTTGKTIGEIVPTIRGPKGSTVVLTIERNGTAQDVPVTRDVIQREDVRSEVMADGKVGYIKIDGFSSGSAGDFHNELDALINQDHVQAIVLDLRDDPGGYVDAAQKIASEFIADEPLYYEQTATGQPVPQQPIPGGVATDSSIPVVVLVNGGTASASEIVSAAVQGNNRGQLVGSQTYGKGTIQEFKELPGAGGYRLSVRKWLTPEQIWIHGVGLTPNVVVEPPADQPADQDAVLDRGIEVALEALANPSSTFPPPVTPAPTPVPSPTPAADVSDWVLQVSLASNVRVG